MLKSISKKIMSGFLAASMVVTLMPATPAQAATASISGKTAAVSGTTYNYTVKNVASSQYIKVKLSGTATGAVATVNKKTVKNGKTSAFVKGTGKDLTVKVAAKNAGKSYKLTVKVYKKDKKTVVKTLTTTAKVYSHSISKITGSTTVEVGKKVTLKAVKKYSQSTKAVTWASSKTSVATVGKTTGVVTGKKAGTATITATCGTSKKTVKVTVKAKAEEEKPEEPTDKPDDTVVSGDTVSGDTVSGDTVSGDTVSGDTVSGDTVSGDTVSGDTVSGDTVSGDTVSGDTVSNNVLAITGVTQIGAKKLSVSFNQSVSSDVTYTVKKDSSKIGVASATLSTDKKSAIIELGAAITEATYTVEAKVGTAVISGNTTGQTAIVKTISFPTDEAAYGYSDDAVKITVNGYNQFNEVASLTSATTVSNYGEVAAPDKDGIIKVTNLKTAGRNYGDTITVTVIMGTVVKNQVIKLVKNESIVSVKFGELYNNNSTYAGEVLNKANFGSHADNYYLPIEVKDKDGNSIKADRLNTLEDAKTVIVQTSDENVVKFNDTMFADVDGKTYIHLAAGTTQKAGTAVISIVTTSGVSATYQLTISKNPEVVAIELAGPESDLKENVATVFGINVTDTDGKAIDLFKYAEIQGNALKITYYDDVVTVKASTAGTAFSIVKDYTKKTAVVKLRPVAKGSETVMATSSYGKVATKTYTVGDAQKATSIYGIKTEGTKYFTPYLANDGSITSLRGFVQVADQSGDLMEAVVPTYKNIDQVDKNADNGFYYIIEQLSSTATTYTQGTDTITSKVIEGISATDTYKVTLYEVDANKWKELDSKNFTVTVVNRNNLDKINISYDGTVYAANGATADYDKVMTLTGTFNGKDVKMNPADVTKVVASDAGAVIDAGTGKITAKGSEAITFEAEKTSKDVVITAYINTKTDTVTAQTTVTFSTVAPYAATIVSTKFGETATVDGTVELSATKLVSNKVFGSAAVDDTTTGLVLYAKDQYGVAYETGASYTITNIVDKDSTGSEFTDATIDTTGKITGVTTEIAAGDSFTLLFTCGSLSKTLKVVVGD